MLLQENHVELHLSNNVSYEEENGASSDEEDDEPPPLPPPRLDSLKKQNGTPIVDRPLPSIPASVSLNEIYDNSDSIEEVIYNWIMKNEYFNMQYLIFKFRMQ